MNFKGTELLKITDSKALDKESLGKITFSAVSIDSRKIKKSEAFFAIKGEVYDAHDFIFDVIKKGARAIIASKKWYRKLPPKKQLALKRKNVVLVNDTTAALGEFARNHRKKFLIPVIAVAGSNGKTTTKDFIAHVLGSSYNILKTEGNLNNAIGVPLTLLRLRREHILAVIELGTNKFGEVKSLCHLAEPQLGVITNIGKEHLEFFKNIEGAAKAECELMDYLRDDFGTFFLNGDDKILAARAKKLDTRVISYGSKGKPEIFGRIKSFKGFYPEIEIKYKHKKYRAVLNSIGSQSFSSALAAAAVGLFFDIPLEDILRAIKNYVPESSKRNRLVKVNGYYIIDDTYNSNPDSLKAALENLKQYKTGGLKHVVLSDMLELGSSTAREHKAAGELVKKLRSGCLYTYGKESYKTFLGARGIANNFYFEDKQSLIDMLKLTVKKGDIVLVKGSRSMKMEEVVNSLI